MVVTAAGQHCPTVCFALPCFASTLSGCYGRPYVHPHAELQGKHTSLGTHVLLFPGSLSLCHYPNCCYCRMLLLSYTGIVQRRWVWLLLFSPLWGSLFINFGLGPIVSRTSDTLPIAANTAAFLLAALSPAVLQRLWDGPSDDAAKPPTPPPMSQPPTTPTPPAAAAPPAAAEQPPASSTQD
jgi:hypothetical protein